jgi:hypothetical protein
MELVDADFRTTREADELNTKLMPKLGMNVRYGPARLAIARSLSIRDEPPEPEATEEDDGKAIKGRQLFGDDLATWTALIVERAKRDDITKRDIQHLVRRHWHRGVHLLWNEWKECGEDYDRFILRLAERAGMREGQGELPIVGGAAPQTQLKATPVILSIGNPSIDVSTRASVTWVLNGRGKSPHIAVMGTLGTGKTRTALSMLRSVQQQAKCSVLLFDMEKGDLAGDTNLARELNATVVRTSQEPVPLDVLFAGEGTEREINDASLRFRDSFSRVSPNKLGGAQLDALREAVRRALQASRPTRLVDVRDRVREVYSEKKRAEDVVVATFNDLTLSEYFNPRMSPADFFGKSWIIDIHEVPETAQRLIVFLILDALDVWCRSLPEAPLDENGHRAIRLAIGIDEARKVLGYEQPSLVSLVRTSRSKGVALALISQSPDDYDREDENFLANIGLAVCFRTSAKSSALNAVLGQTIDLASLPDGVCVTRLPERPGVIRVKAWE